MPVLTYNFIDHNQQKLWGFSTFSPLFVGQMPNAAPCMKVSLVYILASTDQ